MIQRIQSVYLLLAGLIPAICIFIPLARFSVGEGYYTMYSFKYDVVGLSSTTTGHPWGVLTFLLLAGVLSIYTIFCFKNRKRQMLLCKTVVVSHILFYVAYVAYSVVFASRTGADFCPVWLAALPLLSLVFATLAGKAVKRDDDLIKSADRIR